MLQVAGIPYPLDSCARTAVGPTAARSPGNSFQGDDSHSRILAAYANGAQVDAAMKNAGGGQLGLLTLRRL